MGMRVAAVDVQADKLRLAQAVGADSVVDATAQDPIAAIQEQIGGARGVLATAPSQAAVSQGVGMLRRHGTLALVGLPQAILTSVFLT